MEPRSNIEKPKDRKVKRQKNQKTEDMEIIEIKKDQQQYISEIAALESDIFPDPCRYLLFAILIFFNFMLTLN